MSLGANKQALMGAAGAAGGGGDFYSHQIANSCRFNGAGRLLRTNGSAPTLATKYTFSTWIKRSKLSSAQIIFGAETNNVNYDYFNFRTDNLLEQTSQRSTTYMTRDLSVYRDTSAYYHLVFQWDTTLASATDRLKVYVNGVRLSWDQTQYSGAIPQDTALKLNENGASLSVGYTVSYTSYLNGYMAQTAGIDGSIVAIGDLGETKNGVWIAKDLSGLTFGNNGFLLDYALSGDMGNDVSGNNNDFTPTSIEAHDQMLDSPTFNSDSNGGNFCTANSVYRGESTTDAQYGVLSEVNLTHSYSGSYDGAIPCTHKVPASGKWYFEYRIDAGGGSSGFSPAMGIMDPNEFTFTSSTIGQDGLISYDNAQNRIEKNNVIVGTYGGSRGSNGDVMGIAVDMDNGAFYVSKNGTFQAISGGSTGDPTSGASRTGAGATWTPASEYTSGMVPMSQPTGGSTPIITMNFGQNGTFNGNETAGGNSDTNGYGNFFSAVPSGYSAICSGALTVADAVDPAQTDDDYPQKLFNPLTYTASGGDSYTGLGFQPDWVWVKWRGGTQSHGLFDSSRGTSKVLNSDNSNAEATSSGLTSFDTDGYTMGQYYNQNARAYVSWNWRANAGTTAANSVGATSSVTQVDPSGGFSIVTYTGFSGSSGSSTVGHGMGVAPNMIIHKSRSRTSGWWTQVPNLLTDAGYFLDLSGTNAQTNLNSYGTMNVPTTSVFTINGVDGVGGESANYVAYCFANIEGYCKVGSYVGNGNDDGTFVYTGFRPAMMILKELVVDDWLIYDDKRVGYNNDSAGNAVLYPNAAYAEGNQASRAIDILSNGFKLRTSNATGNAGSGNYIYLAMAHNPFKYATAR